MKKSPVLISFLQAVGLSVYVLVVAFIIQNMSYWVSHQTPQILMMIIFLLIFVVSALISGSIVLGYPLFLFTKGEKKMAAKIVGFTIAWLIVGTIAVILLSQLFVHPKPLI